MARSNVFRAPKQNFGKLLVQKKDFLMSVYLLLAVQVAITSYVVHYLRQHEELQKKIHKYFIAWFVLSIVVIIILAVVRMPIWMKFCVFTAFSVLMGINCIAASAKVPIEVIKSALFATFGIFTFMTVFGFVLAYAGINLQFMSFALTMALFGLLIALLLVHFMKVSSAVMKLILTMGVVLFSVFVAYDTNVMIQPGFVGDIVTAAIGLYLDILNIFTFLTDMDLS